MFIALLLAASAPDAPRAAGVEITSQKTVDELQTCFTRIWISKGRITPMPLSDGVDLYFQMRNFAILGPGKEMAIFEIREQGESRKVTVSYRHPFSAKGATGMLNNTMKRCEAPEKEKGGS